MAKSDGYDWANGATLHEHSRKKHAILEEYLHLYLSVRCSYPRRKLRLAVVDGFCGGGRYKCGSDGSPIIFARAAIEAVKGINFQRDIDGMPPIDVELLLVINDFDPSAVKLCEQHLAPYVAKARDPEGHLTLNVHTLSEKFESAYIKIKTILSESGFDKNVIFCLDQYGTRDVEFKTLKDILTTYNRAEVFFTFSISTFLTYLPKTDPVELERRLSKFNVSLDQITEDRAWINGNDLLAEVEFLVFENLKNIGPFTSPFSIHNPDGWRYWLIHFANHDRARQVYNDVLHRNAGTQAHAGRIGLKMLSFDPQRDASLYLFDKQDRDRALDQLYADIPEVVFDLGGSVSVESFYKHIYNDTPSHSDDIHKAMIENPELIVQTETGAERRVAHQIKRNDRLVLKSQRTFPKFLSRPTDKRPT